VRSGRVCPRATALIPNVHFVPTPPKLRWEIAFSGVHGVDLDHVVVHVVGGQGCQQGVAGLRDQCSDWSVYKWLTFALWRRAALDGHGRRHYVSLFVVLGARSNQQRSGARCAGRPLEGIGHTGGSSGIVPGRTRGDPVSTFWSVISGRRRICTGTGQRILLPEWP